VDSWDFKRTNYPKYEHYTRTQRCIPLRAAAIVVDSRMPTEFDESTARIV
jgi:hypothetical protein